MNLELIIQPAMNCIVKRLPITLHVYAGNIQDPVTFQNTVNYTVINNITSQVSLANNQKLTHKDYYQQNIIYKRFYIQSNTLTGLNRNISTAGDYIVCQGLYYKIVEVLANYQTGWVEVIGAESSSETIG